MEEAAQDDVAVALRDRTCAGGLSRYTEWTLLHRGAGVTFDDISDLGLLLWRDSLEQRINMVSRECSARWMWPRMLYLINDALRERR